MALVWAVTYLSILCFSLLGGALADSLDRRTVMLAGQATMLAASLMLAGLEQVGQLTPWLEQGSGLTPYGPRVVGLPGGERLDALRLILARGRPGRPSRTGHHLRGGVWLVCGRPQVARAAVEGVPQPRPSAS